jgi:hypothetical protein
VSGTLVIPAATPSPSFCPVNFTSVGSVWGMGTLVRRLRIGLL